MTATGWCEPARHERVLDDVGGGVGGGERDGDDEVGEREPEQDQHEHLAPPARQQLLQHGDAALAVRAVRGHLRGRRAGPRTASPAPGRGWPPGRGARRPGRRCRAGSRGSRSSRPRSGTSPSTRGRSDGRPRARRGGGPCRSQTRRGPAVRWRVRIAGPLVGEAAAVPIPDSLTAGQAPSPHPELHDRPLHVHAPPTIPRGRVDRRARRRRRGRTRGHRSGNRARAPGLLHVHRVTRSSRWRRRPERRRPSPTRTSTSRTTIREVTGGGADVVVDPIGGPKVESALRALRWEGRYLVVGFAVRRHPRFPLNQVLLNSRTVVGHRAGRLGPAQPGRLPRPCPRAR